MELQRAGDMSLPTAPSGPFQPPAPHWQAAAGGALGPTGSDGSRYPSGSPFVQGPNPPGHPMPPPQALPATRLQAPPMPQPAFHNYQTPAEAMAAAIAAANAAAAAEAAARAAQYGVGPPQARSQAQPKAAPPTPSPAPARTPLTPQDTHWTPGFPVTKDARLDNLARLLNSVPPEALPVGDVVDTREQYGTLMAYLEPWVTAPPTESLAVVRRPNPLVLDCKNIRCVQRGPLVGGLPVG